MAVRFREANQFTNKIVNGQPLFSFRFRSCSMGNSHPGRARRKPASQGPVFQQWNFTVERALVQLA